MNQPPIHTKKSLLPGLEPDEEQDDSWQVSYLDIITIVLGFLIILLSVSQFGKTPMSSLSTLFGKNSDETEYITTPIEEIQEQLELLLSDQIALGNIEIVRDLNDLRIRFKGDDFYGSGNTALEPKARLILEDVLNAFQEMNRTDFNIDVEGHTDNAPIRSSRFPSNWELSTARASNVVKYFKDSGISDKRLKASGYADSRPVIQYDSLGFPYAAERDMNRRVVLRLYYTADELRAANNDTLDTGSQPAVTDETINTQAQRLREAARARPVSEGSVRRDLANEPAVQQEPVSSSSAVEREPATPVSQPATRPETAEPEVTYTQPPTIVKDTPLNVPSFIEPGTECRFSYQFAAAANLSSAFRQARRIETEMDSGISIWLAGEQFSVRSAPQSSLDELVRTMPDNAEGVIHQCVTGNADIPGSIRYQVQFGAFQNENNALDYVVQLLDSYDIQAYMNRSANTYNVVTGPFEDRSEVSSEINRYRSMGIEANMFIKYVEQSPSADGYLYQIEFARSSVETDLIPIRDRLNNGAVIQSAGDVFVLLSPQIQEEDRARQLLSSARSNYSALSPVLFLLEFY